MSLEIVAFILYFAAMIAIGLRFFLKAKGASEKDYFLEVNCGCTVANSGWSGTLRSFMKLANAEMYMNRLKLLQFLFVLAIVLALVFGILLFNPSLRDNATGRIGLWCGFISQFLLAVVMYSEIRRDKRR